MNFLFLIIVICKCLLFLCVDYTAQFIVTGSEEALSIVSVLLQCAK